MPKKLSQAKKFFTKCSSKKTKIYKKAPPNKKIIARSNNIPPEIESKISFFQKLQKKINQYKIIIWVQFFITMLIVSAIIILIGLYQNIQKHSLFSFLTEKSVKPYPLLTDVPKTTVSSNAYAVYEKDSRVFVIAKNENHRFAPASAAKIMTALVAIEKYQLQTKFIAKGVKLVEGSKMGLFEDEEISVENLLYGLMLPSGNDAAHVLAENYPGGKTEFVSKMNQKASELQLQNTHFVDPSGYEDENYSSARDMVRLAAIAEENSEIKKIVSTKNKIVADTSGAITHNLSNLNELLILPGVTGIKTGFTDYAKGVLVTSYIHNGKTYIISVLHSDDRFFDSKALLTEVVKNIKLLNY